MVTGHRRIHHPTLVVERLLNVIDRLGPSRAISGGAAGADTLFAGAAITAGVPLEIMLPNRWYTERYPSAVNAAILSAAQRVTFVVDRPDRTDWRRSWDTQAWWRDNFVRNTAMLDASTHVVVVSGRHPAELVCERRGGTAGCLRSFAGRQPAGPLLWVPDDPDRAVRRVRFSPTRPAATS